MDEPEKKITATTDSEGNKSAMRMMCLSALWASIVLAGANALGYTADGFDSDLILYFLVAAFGGKAGQKFAENK